MDHIERDQWVSGAEISELGADIGAITPPLIDTKTQIFRSDLEANLSPGEIATPSEA
jgi:hypothetical protein